MIIGWATGPSDVEDTAALDKPVTGAVCVAAAAVINGTIAHRLARSDHANPRNVVIEHPAGKILIRLETKTTGPSIDIVAGTIRTARLIMRGEVMVPN